MHISSVRLGHANNSSSTHSILLNSPLKANHADDFQYGWEWFHLKDADSKARYMAAMIYGALEQDMSKEHAAIVAGSLTGTPILEHVNSKDEDGYGVMTHVDHQSEIAFPNEFGSNKYGKPGTYDANFMREFTDYVIKSPNVSVRGGNDNEEDPEIAAAIGERKFEDLPLEHSRGLLFCRKDGEWWVLYNKSTGAKVRLSLVDKPDLFVAKTPELIDIKITDYCPIGCKFCYQDSTKNGKHATLETLQSLAYDLEKAKVFEIALGGGETTMHPDFPKILEMFFNHGITVNFTTFDMRWTKNEAIVEAVKKYCRSFAMSDPGQVKALALWNEALGGPYTGKGPLGTLQVPMGCYVDDAVKRALKQAKALNVDVTLLGFKHFGRGEVFNPGKYAWVIKFLKDDGWWKFGADSVFVQQFKDELKDIGVHQMLMVDKEGAYSCYIDAVNMQMGASSYTKELHDVVLKQDKLFAKFPYAVV